MPSDGGSCGASSSSPWKRRLATTMATTGSYHTICLHDHHHVSHHHHQQQHHRPWHHFRPLRFPPNSIPPLVTAAAVMMSGRDDHLSLCNVPLSSFLCFIPLVRCLDTHAGLALESPHLSCCYPRVLPPIASSFTFRIAFSFNPNPIAHSPSHDSCGIYGML